MFLILDVTDFKIFYTSKLFAPRSHTRIARVVETERHLFLGKEIITLSPAVHIKLDTTMHAKSHHFSLSSLLLFHLLIYCKAPTPLAQWLVNPIRLCLPPLLLPMLSLRR
jgi:hypothetical protein